MEHSPREANRFSVSQEIFRILWNPKKVNYLIHKCLTRVPILSQLDALHTPYPTSWRYILISSSHLHLGLPSVSFPQVFPPKPCTRLSFPHTRHMFRSTHSSRFYYPNYIACEQTIKPHKNNINSNNITLYWQKYFNSINYCLLKLNYILSLNAHSSVERLKDV